MHDEIKEKLKCYINKSKIPNILFYGNSGSGKKTIVKWFLNEMYNKNEMKTYVLEVDCARGKGIKFIRDELKFFAKTNIHYSSNNHLFKTIVLYNTDKLTTDAQSALRRCIELFSHTTRFILIVEDKFKLLNPIISRFCEIYVQYPLINSKEVNLHKQILVNDENIKQKETYLKKKLKICTPQDQNELLKITDKLYERAYCVNDLVNYLNQSKKIDYEKKITLLVCIDKMKKEIKNEKIMMLFILDILFFRSTFDLENIINI